MRDFGKRLQELREAQGLTLRDLDLKSGVREQNLRLYEKGRSPSAQILSDLADALGTTTDYLLGRTEGKAPK